MIDTLRQLLAPLAPLYGAVAEIRNLLFDKGILTSTKAAIPVVSIGNITAGGSGKTPLVDLVVKQYLSMGITPAVIARGYKRSTSGVQLVSDGRAILLQGREAGDETWMLARMNPEAIVVVAEKRVAGASFIMQHFTASPPKVIVLDDAFQHRQIQRDLDILVVNAAAPFLDELMLPTGNLREPLHNVTRADLAVVTKISPRHDGSRHIRYLEQLGIPVVSTRLKPGYPVRIEPDGSPGRNDRSLTGKVYALAGIGQPENFLETLRETGMEPIGSVFTGDHEPFGASELSTLTLKAKKEGAAIIMTEKDYSRMHDDLPFRDMAAECRCYYLPVTMDITSGADLLQRNLEQVLRQ